MFSVYGLMFNGGLGNLGRIGSLRNLGQAPNTPTRQIGPKGSNRQKKPKRYCHREQLGEVKRKKYDFFAHFFRYADRMHDAIVTLHRQSESEVEILCDRPIWKHG